MSHRPHIPSYSQGFASHAGESENPGLWRGLAGLWMPSLGPTGVTLRDWSGYGNHGTLTNMDPATDWVATEKGWALNFAGPGQNEYVAATTSDVLAPTSGVTCSAWVRLETAGDPYGGIIHGPHDGDSSSYIMGVHNDRKPYFTFREGASWNTIYADAAVTLGEWFHVAGTWDGAGDVIYINGALQADTDTGTSINYGAQNQPLTLGKYTTGESDGDIISAAVWDRALTPNEIQQLYIDPHALVRLRPRTVAKAGAAPAGGTPSPRSQLAGPIVGPLGGVI